MNETKVKRIPYRVSMEIGNVEYEFWVSPSRRQVTGVMRIDGEKVSAKVKCSPKDTWDPIIGVALCKLKLENKTGYVNVNGQRKGWPRIKELLYNEEEDTIMTLDTIIKVYECGVSQ